MYTVMWECSLLLVHVYQRRLKVPSLTWKPFLDISFGKDTILMGHIVFLLVFLFFQGQLAGTQSLHSAESLLVTTRTLNAWCLSTKSNTCPSEIIAWTCINIWMFISLFLDFCSISFLFLKPPDCIALYIF